jgi:NADH:ubiquinone oxidoreductase subunit 4 (subunit M)
MDWFDDWALTLAVFIPAVGMAIVLLIPRAQEELIKIVTLFTSLATLGVGIAILARFDFDGDGDVDLAVTTIDGSAVSLFFNQGDGTFGG